MAEIFAVLYIHEFREYRKLAKIKSRKRSLEYCLESVTWDVIVPLHLTKSENTRVLAGNVPNQGYIFVHSNSKQVFLVVSMNATLKLEPTRHYWLPFLTKNKEPNLNTRHAELACGNR